MLRRTVVKMGFTAPMIETTPLVNQSAYHWNYLFPQGMEAPQRPNRNVEMPNTRTPINKFRSVWIETEVHPSLRVALEPFLSKLPLTRTVPKTTIEEAMADFSTYGPSIDHTPSRLGWFAKVVQLAGILGKYDAVKGAWEEELAALDKAGEKPPVELVKAVLYCMSTSKSADLAPLFKRCLKDEFNYSPQFSEQLWNSLLAGAGKLGDENLVVSMLEEALDVQAQLDHFSAQAVVYGLNAVKGADQYDYVKKFLFNFGDEKTGSLAGAYRKLRSTEEDAEDALPQNDQMYYHVLWHARIRGKQQFSPRQLYFDYKPATAGSGKDESASKVKDIVAEKIAKWKEEGLLPDDYEHDEKVLDLSERHKNLLRTEFWMASERKWYQKKKLGFSGSKPM